MRNNVMEYNRKVVLY